MDNTNIKIALVDNKDNITGYADKLEVHKKGLLHRAFSIFIFNNKKELLLQQRSAIKYHSPLLWSNTCCSHLIENVDFYNYMHERLFYEMGIDTDLKFLFKFHYRIHFENNLIENEIDHVFVGKLNKNPQTNPMEVENYKWLDFNFLKNDIKENQLLYTFWLKEALKHFSYKKA